MYRNSTPSTGRRSTRSARGSAKRRRTDGSSRKRKFEEVAQTRAKKWVQIFSPPAPGITFKIRKWVPYAELSEKERVEYDAMEAKKRQVESQQSSEIDPSQTQYAKESSTMTPDETPRQSAIEETKSPIPVSTPSN